VRETRTLTVCDMLMQDGALARDYDPQVQREDAIQELSYHNVKVDDKLLTFTETPEEAVEGAHAIVILTEWD